MDRWTLIGAESLLDLVIRGYITDIAPLDERTIVDVLLKREATIERNAKEYHCPLPFHGLFTNVIFSVLGVVPADVGV